jgi:hypothetical protein
MEDRRNVPKCDSFYDFMVRIRDWYGTMIAFKSEEHEWSYEDIYRMVLNVSSVIKSKQLIYCIDVTDPVLFFVVFMAVTISGNIAWLSENAECEQYIYISDNEVKEMLKNSNVYEIEDKYDKGKVSVVAQSSGTTSISKGVMLSQNNILTDMVAGVREYDYPRGAIYYKVLPYQHLFGLVADLLGPLYSGGTICYSRDSLNMFKYLNFFKPTHMNLPPVIVYMIEKMLLSSSNLEKTTGGKLRKIMCAGASIEQESINVLKKYDIDVFVAYGLTECSPCISMNSDMNHKDGSVGKILQGVNVKIEDNEILISGNTVMLGYWNDQRATDEVYKNGWLKTGDLGYMDTDGFLYLTGRKSNLIVFEDGTKLSPENFESEINSIAGVKECLVYSVVKNGRTTINVKVVIEANQEVYIINGVKEIANKMHLSSKLREIEVVENELPKNKLGKIIRKAN